MHRTRRRFSPSPPGCVFLGPAFNACASATPEIDAALLRYRQSRRSPIGNILTAPMEEDVLVMDGVLVVNRDDDSSDGSSRSVRIGSGMRRNWSADDMVCRSSEEIGSRRSGTKCQYAHGKEQVRGGHRIWKQKAEDILGQRSGKPSPRSAGSFTYGGSKPIHFIPLPGLNSPNIPSPTSASPPAFGTSNHPRNERDAPSTASGSSSAPSSFTWPPTKDEEAYITRVLYGPSSRRRLPVFEEICPQ